MTKVNQVALCYTNNMEYIPYTPLEGYIRDLNIDSMLISNIRIYAYNHCFNKLTLVENRALSDLKNAYALFMHHRNCDSKKEVLEMIYKAQYTFKNPYANNSYSGVVNKDTYYSDTHEQYKCSYYLESFAAYINKNWNKLSDEARQTELHNAVNKCCIFLGIDPESIIDCNSESFYGYLLGLQELGRFVKSKEAILERANENFPETYDKLCYLLEDLLGWFRESYLFKTYRDRLVHIYTNFRKSKSVKKLLEALSKLNNDIYLETHMTRPELLAIMDRLHIILKMDEYVHIVNNLNELNKALIALNSLFNHNTVVNRLNKFQTEIKAYTQSDKVTNTKYSKQNNKSKIKDEDITIKSIKNLVSEMLDYLVNTMSDIKGLDKELSALESHALYRINYLKFQKDTTKTDIIFTLKRAMYTLDNLHTKESDTCVEYLNKCIEDIRKHWNVKNQLEQNEATMIIFNTICEMLKIVPDSISDI